MMKKILLCVMCSFGLTDLMAQSMEWLCHPGKYTNIHYMGNDLFKVKNNNNKWGIISADGKEVLSIKYDSITYFVEDRALILDKSGQRIIGILDQNGETIKSFDNEKVFTTNYPFYKEGLLPYKESNGLCGYINAQGIISVKARFYLAAPFQNGYATVQYADGDGYFGIINKSGGSAIISDTKYNFLSSMVDGKLLAVTSSSRGGALLRIMALDGNQLKSVKTLESKMYVDLSDDFTYLMSQNGHHYFIDNQWRISGANYKLTFPYQIKEEKTFVTESSEILSKQVTKNGVQITYMGKPILEHSFKNVETYEKKYAIVDAKDKSIGVLKLNPSAGIELKSPTQVFVFNHNTLPSLSSSNLEELDPVNYIEIPVDMKDVDPKQLKCYINNNGYLRYAPLKEANGQWKMHLPFFLAATKFDNTVTSKVDVAVTYDGLDWMHRMIELSTKHEAGYTVSISGPNEAKNGNGYLDITIHSVKGIPNKQVRVDITGQKSRYLTFKQADESIKVSFSNIPEGGSKTFEYTITISEEGCPIVKDVVQKRISHPKHTPTTPKEEKKEKKQIKVM